MPILSDWYNCLLSHRELTGLVHAMNTKPRGQVTKSETSTVAEAAPTSMSPREVRRLKSSDLLGAQAEIIIEHDGGDYHLKCTGKGELILTK